MPRSSALSSKRWQLQVWRGFEAEDASYEALQWLSVLRSPLGRLVNYEDWMP